MEVNEERACWGSIEWNESFEQNLNEEVSPIIGKIKEDLFYFPQAFIQIANYELLLDHLNIQLQIPFDEMEYDDVPCELIPKMIQSIQEFIHQKQYRSRNPNEVIKHYYRSTLEGIPLYYATSTVGEFLSLLDELCEFLKEAHEKKKDIVVSL